MGNPVEGGGLLLLLLLAGDVDRCATLLLLLLFPPLWLLWDYSGLEQGKIFFGIYKKNNSLSIAISSSFSISYSRCSYQIVIYCYSAEKL